MKTFFSLETIMDNFATGKTCVVVCVIDEVGIQFNAEKRHEILSSVGLTKKEYETNQYFLEEFTDEDAAEEYMVNLDGLAKELFFARSYSNGNFVRENKY